MRTQMQALITAVVAVAAKVCGAQATGADNKVVDTRLDRDLAHRACLMKRRLKEIVFLIYKKI